MGCMYTNRHLFRRNGLQKMRKNQQLIFGGGLVRRIFKESQQPAIQTKIVPCPQHWEHVLEKVTLKKKKHDFFIYILFFMGVSLALLDPGSGS
jgi:hypothetical protein